MPEIRIRAMVAKQGIEGYDRDTMALACTLRNAGCDVIYIGCCSTPGKLAMAAVQEDVDVIDLSCLAGGNQQFLSDVEQILKDQSADEIKVIVSNVNQKQDLRFIYDAFKTPARQLSPCMEDIYS